MDFISEELFWFLFGLALMLGEIVTPGFILFFFGVGAWILSLLLWMGISMVFTTQVFIFLFVSVLSLYLFEKYGKNYSRGKLIGSKGVGDFDDIRGKKAKAISDIMPNSGGKVEFHGAVWNAECDIVVRKGTAVEIIERQNLTLKVKPI